MPPTRNKTSDTARPQPADAGSSMARLRSADLFRTHRRLIIEHRGEEYCLRLTSNERLILTKR